MISGKLIQRIKERFPEAKATFGAPPKPSVVFPDVHPDVGDIEIYDDGSELTVVTGHFTHWHATDYHGEPKNEQKIVDNVVSWLERLFADQIVLWGSHSSGGGWYNREVARDSNPYAANSFVQDTMARMKEGKPLYVWSGPLGGEGPNPETAGGPR